MLKKKQLQQPLRRDIPVFEANPEQGLSAQQAADRVEGGWANGAPESASRTEKEILLQNTLTFFNLVFIVMAVILAISCSSIKNMTFLVVAICNTVIGCFQEIRAKRAVDKLTLVAAQKIRTVRD